MYIRYGDRSSSSSLVSLRTAASSSRARSSNALKALREASWSSPPSCASNLETWSATSEAISHPPPRITKANDTAQQPRGLGERWVPKPLHAPAVCCRGGFGHLAPGAVEREVRLTAGRHTTLVVQREPQLVLQPEPIHELLERPGA